MSGVPASNLCGACFQVLFWKSTRQDHLPAALIRRHGFEHFLPAIQHADARRPAHLVAGEGEEIAADLLHVEGRVPGALRGIHERRDAELARARAEFATGLIVPSELEMCVIAKQLHLAGEELVEPAQVEQADVAGDRAGKRACAPVRSASSCQGTMLLWCSISVSRIMSPA